MAPVHGFRAYDDTVVFGEHFTAEQTITQPHEVYPYLWRFATFEECAVYGAEAGAVVRRAPGRPARGVIVTAGFRRGS